MIDKEHGLKATIAAGGIAVLTACCLFAVKPAAVADTGSSAGEPAISQDAAAQEEQPEENTAAAQEGQPEENTAAAQEGQPVNQDAYEYSGRRPQRRRSLCVFMKTCPMSPMSTLRTIIICTCPRQR